MILFLNLMNFLLNQNNTIDNSNLNSLYQNIRNSDNWIQFYQYQNNVNILHNNSEILDTDSENDSESDLESLDIDTDYELEDQMLDINNQILDLNNQNHINRTIDSVINNIELEHIRRQITNIEPNHLSRYNSLNNLLDEILLINNNQMNNSMNDNQMNNNPNNLDSVLFNSFDDELNNCSNTNNVNYKETIKRLKEKKILEEANCSICLEKIEKNTKILKINCKHKFHTKCLDSWLKINNKCPLCRKKI